MLILVQKENELDQDFESFQYWFEHINHDNSLNFLF